MPVSRFRCPVASDQSLTARYGSAGNKDDRLDTYVLADTLRTDGHRWPLLREDHPETKAPRTMCRTCKGLVEIRVQMTNQLRANRELAFPRGGRAAAPPRQPHHSGFLRRFPNATKASWLSPARLERWLRSVGSSGGIAVEMLYRHVERGISTASRQKLIGRSRPVWSPPRNTDRRDHPDRNPDPRTFRRIARSEDIHMPATLRNGQSGNRSGTDRDCRKRFPSDDAWRRSPAPHRRPSDPCTRTNGGSWSCKKNFRRAVMNFASGSRLDDP